MFSQASVILFTDTCQTPPGQTRPLTDTCPGQTPPPPGRHPPWADIRPGQTPSSRQQLQQMVCILLECILVTVRKRSCGKVMFLHLSASHSVHGGGGGCLPQCMRGCTLLSRHPPPTAADGTHPSGILSCS